MNSSQWTLIASGQPVHEQITVEQAGEEFEVFETLLVVLTAEQ
jgi:hypothetical protein